MVDSPNMGMLFDSNCHAPRQNAFETRVRNPEDTAELTRRLHYFKFGPTSVPCRGISNVEFNIKSRHTGCVGMEDDRLR